VQAGVSATYTDGLMCGFLHGRASSSPTVAVLEKYPQRDARRRSAKGSTATSVAAVRFVRIMEAALKAKGMGVARG